MKGLSAEPTANTGSMESGLPSQGRSPGGLWGSDPPSPRSPGHTQLPGPPKETRCQHLPWPLGPGAGRGLWWQGGGCLLLTLPPEVKPLFLFFPSLEAKGLRREKPPVGDLICSSKEPTTPGSPNTPSGTAVLACGPAPPLTPPDTEGYSSSC